MAAKKSKAKKQQQITNWRNKKIAKGAKKGNKTYSAIQKNRKMLDDIMNGY